jgi:hypothetical protein
MTNDSPGRTLAELLAALAPPTKDGGLTGLGSSPSDALFPAARDLGLLSAFGGPPSNALSPAAYDFGRPAPRARLEGRRTAELA